MRTLKFLTPWLCISMLAGCALSAEQRAARAAEEARARRALDIELTAQCDPQAAEHMRALDAARASGNTAAQQKFAKLYQNTIDSALFRNCYRMAWESYLNRRRLEIVERRESLRDMNDWMMWHRPPFCRNVVIDGKIYRYCD